jgi:PIN like domain
MSRGIAAGPQPDDMRLLLDEDVPVQLLEPLRHLLSGHQIDHTEQLGWKGKKDRFLLPDARRRGYDALLTNDSGQLDSVEECRAIRDSQIHHLRYHQDTRRGIDGLALAMAAVMGGIRQVIRELEDVDGQRLVEIQAIQPGRRHRMTDPRIDPPPYWPSRAGHPNRPRRRRAPDE